MKIRLLLVVLGWVLSFPVLGQEHYATPRKEIRHKLKQLTANGQQPEDNCQLSIVNSQLSTRASGE